ncbi:hypothetical protein [Paenibacillus pinistramenti]|uniref:hypothetical protein n=1 Tax=Paenibacillus pinistramenti TaxID=1768003 RepID=UPI0013967DF7|nr:hypothetical protein [Paenibacillus pinistramenti]
MGSFFVKWTPEAQKVFADSGFRSVDPDIEKQYADKYWEKVNKELYGDGGIWDQVVVNQ